MHSSIVFPWLRPSDPPTGGTVTLALSKLLAFPFARGAISRLRGKVPALLQPIAGAGRGAHLGGPVATEPKVRFNEGPARAIDSVGPPSHPKRTSGSSVGTAVLRKLQSFVTCSLSRLTGGGALATEAYASLPSSACASAISGISGVGKSLRAPAAQIPRGRAARRALAGAGYPPAALAKERVRRSRPISRRVLSRSTSHAQWATVFAASSIAATVTSGCAIMLG
jgi:hypothetical protein